MIVGKALERISRPNVLRPNVFAPKCPRAQMFAPKCLAPKCRRPNFSRPTKIPFVTYRWVMTHSLGNAGVALQ